MLQFTARLLAPLTVAENVADWPAGTEAVDGVTAMDTTEAVGVSVIVVCAILVGSATLAAFTLTLCDEAMVAGAV